MKAKSKNKNTAHTELATIRIAINEALHKCLVSATPNVCAMGSTKEGYRELESRILRLCLSKGITPSTAIAELEVELSE